MLVSHILRPRYWKCANIWVVEVAPIYDTRGESTTLAAAEVVHSLIGLMVDTPVQGKL